MKVDLQIYDKISQVLRKQYNNRINTITQFTQMSKERRRTIENYNHERKNAFNIFEDLSISSRFNEIDHSRMLAKILSPDTQDIGDRKNLKIFIELIERIKGHTLDNQFDNKFQVEREFGRTSNIKESGGIDIFIFDEKYSIIIENKITQKARDQDNQLARYYNISVELDRPAIAIIYMPFYYQQPPLENFTGEYRKLIDTIRDLLVIIPALDPGNGNDLTHGFLDECSNYAKSVDKTTAYVCLEQYSKFIKSKGEVDQMAMNCDKEFIKEVLSDENMRKTVEDIFEIWKNREKILKHILLDHLIEKSDFKRIKEVFHGRMINEDLFVYYHPVPFQVGFGSIADKLSEELQEKLKDILTSDSKKINFKGETKSWVWGEINEDFLNDDLEDMKKFISSMVEKLEGEAKEILENAAAT
jgi:hypothetical protein